MFENTIDFAQQLDKNDPLKDFEKNFIFLLLTGKRVFTLPEILWGYNQKQPRNIF